MNAPISEAAKKREKMLIIVCGLMFAVMIVPLMMYLFGGSVTRLQNSKTQLLAKIEEQNNKIKVRIPSLKKINDAAIGALPQNDELAIAEYKNLLATSASQLGFEGVQVDHNRTRIEKAKALRGQSARSAEEHYKAHQFTVRGKVTLDNLCRFLQRFYEVQTTHLIRSITIKPIEEARRIEATIVIEAISIPQTKNKNVVSEKKSDDKTDWRDLTQTITTRNLFAPYRPQIEQVGTPPPPEQPKTADVTKLTYLTGITWADENALAWFSFRMEGQSRRLKIGDSFQVGKAKCTVHKIGDHDVEIETGGAIYSLKVGNSFYDSEWVRDLPDEFGEGESGENGKNGM